MNNIRRNIAVYLRKIADRIYRSPVYFNDKYTGDSTWSNPKNWWRDEYASLPLGYSANCGDNIIIQSSLKWVGFNRYFKSIIFVRDASFLATDGALMGDVTFMADSSLDAERT